MKGSEVSGHVPFRAPAPVLVADDLRKWYGPREVVAGVSFRVMPGEIIGLLGPNGAGKTTSFKMVTGMVPPNGGRVFLRGEDVTRMPMYLRARKGMGYLSQEPSVFRRLTVEENLLAILETMRLPRPEQRRRAEALLVRLGLAGLKGSLAQTLSGGERRRLEIARALLRRPTILMLDEPFSGVDPKAVSDIRRHLKDLSAEGIGVLLTDHNVREALAITHRAYLIDQGAILAEGSPAELVGNALARQRYFGEEFTL